MVTETYNHLHLLMERRTERASGSTCNLNLPDEDGAPLIGTSIETRTYPGAPHGAFPPYNALPANYQLPAVTATVTYSPTDPSKSVAKTTTSESNDYGQVAVAEAYGSSTGADLAPPLLQKTENEYDADNYGLPTRATTTDAVTGTIRVKTVTLSTDGMNVQAVTNGELNATGTLVKDKTRTFEQDSRGRVTKTTLSWADGATHPGATEAAASVKYVRDGNELEVSSTDAIGNTSTHVADVRTGWLLSERDARGNAWLYSYDPLGRPTKLTDPAGSTISRTYTSATDAGAESVDIYSTGTRIPLNRRTLTDDEDGYTTYEYTDGLHRTVRTADNMGEAGAQRLFLASQSFNAIGKPANATNSLGRTQHFAYDDLGQRVRSKNFLGDVAEQTYDDAYTGGDTGVLSASRQITTLINGVTVQHAFENDRKNQVQAVSYPGTTTPTKQTLRYDGLANQTNLSIQDGTLASTRAYGPGGLLASGSVTGDDDIGSDVTYTRDLLGKRYQKTIEQTLADGTTYDYEGSKFESNAMGLLERMTNAAGQRVEATYDPNGNIATVTDRARRVFTSTYDALDRRTSVTTPESPTTSKRKKTFAYTGMFLTKKQLLVDDTATSTITLGYEKDGKLQSKEYADKRKMTWERDEFGRLEQATDYAGVVTTYEYSSETDRLTKVSNPNASVTLAYYDRTNGDFANWSGRPSTLTYDE